MPTFDELLDKFAGPAGSTAVAEPSEADVELEQRLSRWSRYQLPNPQFVADNHLDKLSKPAQKFVAEQFARDKFEGQSATMRNVMGVLDAAGAAPFAVADRLLPGVVPYNSDYMNWVVEAEERINQEREKAGDNAIVPSWVSRPVRGAATSLPVAYAGSKWGGKGGAAAAGAAAEANRALTQGQDAGLEGPKLYAYAGTQAAAEGAIPFIPGLGGLEEKLGKANGAAVKKGIWEALKPYASDIAQENLTSLAQQISNRLYGVDPAALDSPEKWQQMAYDTTAQSIAGGGIVDVSNRAAGAVDDYQRGQRLADIKQQRSDQQTASVFNDAAWTSSDFAKSKVEELFKQGKTHQEVQDFANNPTSAAFESLGLGRRKDRTMPSAAARKAFGENAAAYLASRPQGTSEAKPVTPQPQQPSDQPIDAEFETVPLRIEGPPPIQENSSVQQAPPEVPQVPEVPGGSEPSPAVSPPAPVESPPSLPPEFASASDDELTGLLKSLGVKMPKGATRQDLAAEIQKHLGPLLGRQNEPSPQKPQPPAEPPVDLFGEPIVEKPPEPPPAPETEAPKQENLFDKSGSPGQMNAFDDVGVPDDMVAGRQGQQLDASPILEVPLDRITLSDDVPNFKKGANEAGVVEGEALQGKYERVPANPIVLWERADGRLEVITGRHRLDLARRTGEKTIPSQIVREADGFSKEQAFLLDAESNIRDEKGSVDDFATYFRHSPATEEEARSRGLLSRAAQRQAFGLGKHAADNLYGAWKNGKLSADKAAAIASAAPGDDGLQTAALSRAKNLSADELASLVRQMAANAGQRKQTQGDLFGFDDSAIQEMEAMSKAAGRIKDALKDRILAVAGAIRRPEQAKGMGLQGDMESIQQEVDKLRADLGRWDKWETDPELAGQVRAEVNGKPQSEEDVRGEADVSEANAPGTWAAGFFGGGRVRQRNPLPASAEAPNPAMEERYKKTYGIGRKTILQNIIDLTSALWYATTRTHFNVPNDAAHGAMNERLRLFKTLPSSAQDEAGRNIASVTEALSPAQLAVFERKLIVENQIAALQRGESERESLADLQAYKAVLDPIVAQSPEIQTALARRKAIVKSLYGKLRDHGLLPDMSDDQVETFYHQQVLQFQQAMNQYGPGWLSPQVTKKGFEKGRSKGGKHNDDMGFNTSYLEAEFEWMRDAYHQLAKRQWWNEVKNRYDDIAQLRRDAQGLGVPLERLAKQSKTHALFDVRPGNVLFPAIGVPERVVADVLSGLVQFVPVGKNDLKNLLAMGGPNEQVFIPKELAAQLESMLVPSKGGIVGELSRKVMGAIKTWLLHSPLRVAGFMLRQLTGDIDPVIGGGAIGAARFAPQALRDMTAYYGTFGQQQKLQLSPDMKAARDHGVMQAAMAANELVDVKDLPIFRRLYSESKANLVGLAKGYFDKVKKYDTWRESLSRYASFLYYKDALTKGTLAHYGGASKAKVDQIHQELGVDAAAAHLSRNLLGDYGNLTVTGNFLRQHVLPFYSWQEINLKRYPQIAMNAAMYGPRKVGLKKNPLGAAGLSAVAMAGVAVPYALMKLYNTLFWKDEEEELSDNEKASPHLIYSRNEDGSIGILRNTGALGDFLENFGLETALSRLDELQSGQMTAQQVAVEMGKGVISKWVNMLRPDIKAAGENLAGQSLFPDAFNPRTLNQDERSLGGMLGLRDVRAEIRGRLAGDGARSRPHFVERMIGVTDPKQEAFYAIMDAKDRFLDKQDKGRFPRNEFWKNMQNAALKDDQQAFDEAKAAYFKDGGTRDKLRERLENMGPLARMTDANRIKFKNYLNDSQREKLAMATEYGKKLELKMRAMIRTGRVSVE